MSIKKRTLRQHIFGIAFQFKYHKDADVNALIDSYLSTLSINNKIQKIEEEPIEIEAMVEEILDGETDGNETIQFDFEMEEDLDDEILEEIEVVEEFEEEEEVLVFEDDEDFEGIEREIITDEARAFIYRTISGTYQNLKQIDAYIVKYSKKWSINRLGNEVVTILRIAIYELLYNKETSQKVVINEAVILAKKYCDDDLYKFVNGLLANVTKEINEK